MDGRIALASRPGETTFTLELPASDDDAARRPSREARARGRRARLLALVAGGCSLSDDEPPAAARPTQARPSTARRHRHAHGREDASVDVVEDIGKDGGFDPRAIYSGSAPGVVTVISTFGERRLPGGGEGGLGSGFVLDGEGYVATNAHVVLGEAPKFERASEVYVEFADGNRVPGQDRRHRPERRRRPAEDRPRGPDADAAAARPVAQPHVGAPVAAIGSPFGEEQSLSVGVISALDRDIESLTQFRIGDAIQTDAAINRGNSGGPLLDARGRVIGINSQIKSSSGGGEGVGFAVPVDTVRRSLDQLRETGKVDYGFLGVSASPLYPQLARRLGLPVERGALVAIGGEGLARPTRRACRRARARSSSRASATSRAAAT